jgi:hypothetical protein
LKESRDYGEIWKDVIREIRRGVGIVVLSNGFGRLTFMESRETPLLVCTAPLPLDPPLLKMLKELLLWTQDPRVVVCMCGCVVGLGSVDGRVCREVMGGIEKRITFGMGGEEEFIVVGLI